MANVNPKSFSITKDGITYTLRGLTSTELALIQSISDKATVLTDTTANWNAQLQFIPQAGDIIVYTDHSQKEDGAGNIIEIPGVKIGDGNAYLIDLRAALENYLSNLILHLVADDSADISCAVGLSEGLLGNELQSLSGVVHGDILFRKGLLHLVDHESGDVCEVLLGEILEHNDLVYTADELGTEELSQTLHSLVS